MIISIEKLREYPEFTRTVVDWLYSEWGKDNYDYWYSWILSSTVSDVVPQTFIAIVNNAIVGTYSLWRCDLQSRQDLFPWLGGLYVLPSFRGKKYNGKTIGEHMLSDAIQRSRLANFERLYLFTNKTIDYYVRNGWEYFAEAPDESNATVTICYYRIPV